MGHYDECREEYCGICGHREGNCEHTRPKQPATTYVTSLDDGKVFIGNGAECMVRFIQDGFKGAVCLCSERGNEVAPPLMNRHIWERSNESWVTNYLTWLSELCAYYPPEPVRRDATPREALCAHHIDGKYVEYRLTENAPIEATREWKRVTAEYKAWADPYRVYRIREG